jgi:hypothetical protein
LDQRDLTVTLELREALDQRDNQVNEETTEHLEHKAHLDLEVTMDNRDQVDNPGLQVLLDHQVQEEKWVAPDLLVLRELLEILERQGHLEEMVHRELPDWPGLLDKQAPLASRDREVNLAQPVHRAPKEVLDLRDLKVTWVQLVQPAP